MGCEKCNPVIMAREGCCANNCDVAEKGMKRIRVSVRGLKPYVIEVCRSLEKDPDTGRWSCGDYYERPDICRMFECDRSIKDRLDEEY